MLDVGCYCVDLALALVGPAALASAAAGAYEDVDLDGHAVFVTADIKPFTKIGNRLDVTVSAMGDAKSLNGGVLLQTALLGINGKFYALAQGPLAVGGFSAGTTGAGGANVQKNHPTVAQISGGAIMHIGFTMFEKMHIDGGQVTNASLADYKIPGFHDVPMVMENLYVEHDQSNGPFGAKGVGEVATFCPSPAIANAIDDAVGVRLMEMPLNAEAVYRALRAKQGKPLEDA